MRNLLFLLGMVLLLATHPLPAAEPVIVHEWGTFTCLQDGQGKAIGGINVDDEPVPGFVRQVAIGAAPQYDSPSYWRNVGLPPYNEGKGWIAGDPHVTMRLETPVIYIYPPKGKTPASVPPLDVRVDFHGGVLSQFYPDAYFSGLPFLKVPQQPSMDGKIPHLDEKEGITPNTTTALEWKPVQVGATGQPVETTNKVWTTPREVSAPLLEVKFTEKDFDGVAKTYTQDEKFLFYRGVGHLDSPLWLRRPDSAPFPTVSNEMGLYIEPREFLQKTEPDTPFLKEIDELSASSTYAQVWMVKILPNGNCAFDTLTEVSCKPDNKFRTVYPLVLIHSSFADSHCTSDNLDLLKTSMQKALVKEGLYPDEAAAMLKTWELSYFKSPGLRFFYIVPRAWVDKVLPLKVTEAPTKITRVMVGRIELITDAQKAILAKLTAGPCPDIAAVKKAAHEAMQNSKLPKSDIDAICSGEKPLSDLGITIPPLVQDYLNLGRFRDALIVHEQELHPSAALAQFIKDNKLVPKPD